jgi:hypothetical protein
MRVPSSLFVPRAPHVSIDYPFARCSLRSVGPVYRNRPPEPPALSAVDAPTTARFLTTLPRARAFSGARPHSLALPRLVAPPAEHPRPLSLSLCTRAMKLAVVRRPFYGRP